MAEFYANGLLTIVTAPDAELEQDRDLKRFAHPRQLVSWVGMDTREYASGGKSTRLRITRQGNRRRGR